MKLKKIVKDIYAGAGNDMYLSLDSKILNQIKDMLKECDEFKDVDEFVIIDIPFFDNDKNEIIESHTLKIDENTKFKKRVYLHSISLTPEIYNPEDVFIPVKNGACITPNFYNDSFKPSKKICIDFCPEELQDEENTKRQELHNLLDDVLNYPEQYRIKGDNGVLVRGIFELIERDNKETYREIGEINLDYNNQKNFMVSYMKNVNNSGNINILIKHEFFPIELEEKFKSKFKEKSVITYEDLCTFTKECGIEFS